MNPDVLHQRYAEQCVGDSDIFEHLPTFVKAVKDLKAERVIELGVRYGVSTIAWLYALENQGHLWSVDCSFPVEPPNSNIGLLDPQGPLGVVEYWTFILGYDVWKPVLDALPTTADIIFIDTNHVYSETLVELELYLPRVRPGGRIYLHDTALSETGNDPSGPPYPVRKAVTEFCRKHQLEWENNENCCGLGVIYVD